MRRRRDQAHRPLAYLPDHEPVWETDLDVSWREWRGLLLGTLVVGLFVVLLAFAGAAG